MSLSLSPLPFQTISIVFRHHTCQLREKNHLTGAINMHLEQTEDVLLHCMDGPADQPRSLVRCGTKFRRGGSLPVIIMTDCPRRISLDLRAIDEHIPRIAISIPSKTRGNNSIHWK